MEQVQGEVQATGSSGIGFVIGYFFAVCAAIVFLLFMLGIVSGLDKGFSGSNDNFGLLPLAFSLLAICFAGIAIALIYKAQWARTPAIILSGIGIILGVGLTFSGIVAIFGIPIFIAGIFSFSRSTSIKKYG